MLEKLKLALLEDKGDHIVAKEFLNEAIMWLEYIETLEAKQIPERDLSRRMFILNDVTMNYCTLINWSATIWELNDRVSNGKIADFITEHFCWPNQVSETFMNCIRNPTVHIGRAYMWGEYNASWPLNKAKHGSQYTLTGAFDGNIDPQNCMPPKENPIYEEVRLRVYELGFFERRQNTPPDLPQIMHVTFYYPAFRSLIHKAILGTFVKIKGFNDQEKQKLEDLRNRLSITRVPAPENMG